VPQQEIADLAVHSLSSVPTIQTRPLSR